MHWKEIWLNGGQQAFDVTFCICVPSSFVQISILSLKLIAYVVTPKAFLVFLLLFWLHNLLIK